MREKMSAARNVGVATDALQRDQGRTLYEQVAELLEDELRRDYVVGERIATEDEIGRRYRVSRVTVRRALQTLAKRGVLVRRQGVGTFVAHKRRGFVYEIGQFGPFLDVFSGEDESVDVKLTAFGWEKGEGWPQLAQREEDILTYERVYSTGGSVHAVLRIAVPKVLGEHISRNDVESMGIYRLLQEHLEAPPLRASYRIGSKLPNDALATVFEVSKTTPLLEVERVSYDKYGNPVECTIHYLLPQMYTLAVRVGAAHSGS